MVQLTKILVSFGIGVIVGYVGGVVCIHYFDLDPVAIIAGLVIAIIVLICMYVAEGFC